MVWRGVAWRGRVEKKTKAIALPRFDLTTDSSFRSCLMFLVKEGHQLYSAATHM